MEAIEISITEQLARQFNQLIDMHRDLIEKMNSVVPLPPEKLLWNSETCAKFFGVSKYHFEQKMSKANGFPLPIIISSGEYVTRRWKAQDMLTWVERQKLKV